MTAPISQQQDAHRFTYRDRESAANLRIGLACQQAIALFRVGRGHVGDGYTFRAAEHILRVATERAERILGRQS